MNKRVAVTASLLAGFFALSGPLLAQSGSDGQQSAAPGSASQGSDQIGPGLGNGSGRLGRRGPLAGGNPGGGFSGNGPGGAWQGGGPGGGPDAAARRQRMMQRFDSNHDGVLDDNEKAKMRAFFQERRQQRLERMKQQGLAPGGGQGPGLGNAGSGSHSANGPGQGGSGSQ